MTSVDLLVNINQILEDQYYRITFSPAYKQNWMMYCNGNFIGGLFDEELCLVATESVRLMLKNPEPIYHGYSKNEQHKMFSIPLSFAKEALIATYKDKFDSNTFVYDIRGISKGAAVLENFYDKNVIFLKFCYDNELLRENPLDKNDMIIRMTFLNKDLTTKGLSSLRLLINKFLAFYDRGSKTDLLKMLQKWLLAIENKHIKGRK